MSNETFLDEEGRVVSRPELPLDRQVRVLRRVTAHLLEASRSAGKAAEELKQFGCDPDQDKELRIDSMKLALWISDVRATLIDRIGLAWIERLKR